MFRLWTEVDEQDQKQQQLEEIEEQLQALSCMVYDVHNIVEKQVDSLHDAQLNILEARAVNADAEEQLLQANFLQHQYQTRQGWIGATIGMGVGAAVAVILPPIGIGVTVAQMSMLGGLGGFAWGRWNS